MKPRISVLTLGVEDLNESVAFYQALGFETDGIVGEDFEHGAVCFFDLENGLKLALWPRASISQDTGLPAAPPSATEITLGHNVNTREEVHTLMRSASTAGATILNPTADTFWGGYAGYFQDPDGHVWEVVWNPDLIVE